MNPAKALIQLIAIYCERTGTHKAALYRKAGVSTDRMRWLTERQKMVPEDTDRRIRRTIVLHPDGIKQPGPMKGAENPYVDAVVGSNLLRDACLRYGLRQDRDLGMGYDRFMEAVKEYGVTV